MTIRQIFTGAEQIVHERARQIDQEGWDESQDDDHQDSELAWAAVCYAAPISVYVHDPRQRVHIFEDPWPDDTWERCWDKRTYDDNGLVDNAALPADQRIRNLAKAGALIAAEIDRLQRLARASGH